MMNVRVLIGAVLTAMLFLNGCYMTKEQRWEAFDAERRQEVGVKTTAYYLTEWGKPKKRMRSPRWRGSIDVGVLRLWRRRGLAEDPDLHARWGLKGFSAGILAQRSLVSRNVRFPRGLMLRSPTL